MIWRSLVGLSYASVQDQSTFAGYPWPELQLGFAACSTQRVGFGGLGMLSTRDVQWLSSLRPMRDLPWDLRADALEIFGMRLWE